MSDQELLPQQTKSISGPWTCWIGQYPARQADPAANLGQAAIAETAHHLGARSVKPGTVYAVRAINHRTRYTYTVDVKVGNQGSLAVSSVSVYHPRAKVLESVYRILDSLGEEPERPESFPHSPAKRPASVASLRTSATLYQLTLEAIASGAPNAQDLARVVLAANEGAEV